MAGQIDIKNDAARTAETAGAPAATDKPALLARLVLRCEMWVHARLLPFQLKRLSLEETLEFAEPCTGMLRYENLSPAYIARKVRGTTRRPWLMRDRPCLRQGLLTYRYLVHNGLKPTLHFGVDPDVLTATKVSAHCWVTLDGTTLIGASDIPYIEILTYSNNEAVGHGAS